MLFVDQSPLIALRHVHRYGDKFRRFEAALMQFPTAGDLIYGCVNRGARKLNARPDTVTLYFIKNFCTSTRGTGSLIRSSSR
jgi:hypothetical protein